MSSVYSHRERQTNAIDLSFINGLVSGYVGAIAVYPVDLVKTRMQNQTTEVLYKNGADCFRQIIRADGYQTLYRGSITQLIGIGPEKAIKITMNSFVEKRLSDNPLSKIIAGACAGASQVVVTNPIEVVKIQFQMSPPGSRNLLQTINYIGGFQNLYKGASLCFMRDIPFSAIYFPVYGFLKSALKKQFNFSDKASYFVGGTLAGVPAAYLVTPADVIKTRIQTLAGGLQQQNSAAAAAADAIGSIGKNNKTAVIQTAMEIYRNEGFRAFWKGGVWRVYKSAPQFGITLLVYEMLKDLTS